ncbi:MAG: HEPN domain-containing protein [Actinobacteria bacterium]|nr:HEPN domain-containing protein [Actinomycetota bacterium]
MLDAPEFEPWQAAADDTLAGAEAQRHAGLFNWACFLSEQAAKLSLKALLHAVGADAWAMIWSTSVTTSGKRWAPSCPTTSLPRSGDCRGTTSRLATQTPMPQEHPARTTAPTTRTRPSLTPFE